jgi:hypothetical protein
LNLGIRLPLLIAIATTITPIPANGQLDFGWKAIAKSMRKLKTRKV